MKRNKRQNVAFMAVAAGKEAPEGTTNFPKYVGVGSYKVLMVNPSKAELEKLYPGRTIEAEPNYLIAEDKDQNKPRGVRLDFYLESIPDRNGGAEFISKITYFLSDCPFINKDDTKCQFIDAYGETAWLPKDTKELPEGSRLTTKSIRKAYRGEEGLTKFVKAMLNIPDRGYFKDGEFKLSANMKTEKDLEACYVQLENIPSYFTGNVKELKDIISGAINSKLQLLTGVRTTSENKTYVDFYTRLPLKYSVTKFDYLSKQVFSDKENGAYPNTEFGDGPAFVFKEYKVTPTNLEATTTVAEDLPMGW